MSSVECRASLHVNEFLTEKAKDIRNAFHKSHMYT